MEGPRGALGGEAVFKMALLGASWGAQGPKQWHFEGSQNLTRFQVGAMQAPGRPREPF